MLQGMDLVHRFQSLPTLQPAAARHSSNHAAMACLLRHRWQRVYGHTHKPCVCAAGSLVAAERAGEWEGKVSATASSRLSSKLRGEATPADWRLLEQQCSHLQQLLSLHVILVVLSDDVLPDIFSVPEVMVSSAFDDRSPCCQLHCCRWAACTKKQNHCCAQSHGQPRSSCYRLRSSTCHASVTLKHWMIQHTTRSMTPRWVCDGFDYSSEMFVPGAQSI